MEVLDEQIVYQNGPFLRVKRWLRGSYPELGIIHCGLTGIETIVEKDVIRPIHTFSIYEADHANQTFLRRVDS